MNMFQTLIQTIAAAAVLTLSVAAAFAADRPLVKTDLDRVYDSGQISTPGGAAFALAPGIYVIGDEDNKVFGTHYLLVDEYVNDPGKVLAILVPQAIESGADSVSGYIYQGRPLGDGTSLMLAPVIIDEFGNVSVDSELSQNSPVIQVTMKNDAGRLRYPYMLEGHNGALDGQMLGMRASGSTKPQLNAWPQSNIFEGSGRGGISVSGNIVTYNDGVRGQARYQRVPLNGDMGKIAALVRARLNTMSESMVSQNKAEMLAIFLSGCFGSEKFVLARRAEKPGKYSFQIFQNQSRTFTDRVVPGRLTPRPWEQPRHEGN